MFSKIVLTSDEKSKIIPEGTTVLMIMSYIDDPIKLTELPASVKKVFIKMKKINIEPKLLANVETIVHYKNIEFILDNLKDIGICSASVFGLCCESVKFADDICTQFTIMVTDKFTSVESHKFIVEIVEFALFSYSGSCYLRSALEKLTVKPRRLKEMIISESALVYPAKVWVNADYIDQRGIEKAIIHVYSSTSGVFKVQAINNCDNDIRKCYKIEFYKNNLDYVDIMRKTKHGEKRSKIIVDPYCRTNTMCEPKKYESMTTKDVFNEIIDSLNRYANREQSIWFDNSTASKIVLQKSFDLLTYFINKNSIEVSVHILHEDVRTGFYFEFGSKKNYIEPFTHSIIPEFVVNKSDNLIVYSNVYSNYMNSFIPDSYRNINAKTIKLMAWFMRILEIKYKQFGIKYIANKIGLVLDGSINTLCFSRTHTIFRNIVEAIKIVLSSNYGRLGASLSRGTDYWVLKRESTPTTNWQVHDTITDRMTILEDVSEHSLDSDGNIFKDNASNGDFDILWSKSSLDLTVNIEVDDNIYARKKQNRTINNNIFAYILDNLRHNNQHDQSIKLPKPIPKDNIQTVAYWIEELSECKLEVKFEKNADNLVDEINIKFDGYKIISADYNNHLTKILNRCQFFDVRSDYEHMIFHSWGTVTEPAPDVWAN